MTKPTCYHEQKQIVWSLVGNDGTPLVIRQLRYQCGDCGRLLPNALPHSMANPETPSVDLAALQQWIAHDQEHWNKHRIESKKIDQIRQEEWRAKYEQYLMSEAWMLKREKVFERCKGICDGCRENKATAVHHLTYEHLGNELLWELAGVCRDCHERAHSIGDTSPTQNQPPINSRRPPLHDMSTVLPKTEKTTSEIEVSRRHHRYQGLDVGMQSLHVDWRRKL